DLTLAPRGYFDGIYSSPFQDQALADLALTVLDDRNLALGRRGKTDLLALSFSAHDVVSHTFGNESEEELDTLRRLDHELGRLLAALDALAAEEPRGSVVLALSADHGFTPLPEVVRRNTGRRIGGRLQSSDSTPETPYPNIQERLNRALTDELCLAPGSQPIYGSEGWTIAYDRTLFPARTVDGPCGAAGQPVTLADLDKAFPRVVQRLYGEEIQEVLLLSQRDQWRADDPTVPFARNDYDEKRSGDAFLIPKEEVLMHWTPNAARATAPTTTTTPTCRSSSGEAPSAPANGPGRARPTTSPQRWLMCWESSCRTRGGCRGPRDRRAEAIHCTYNRGRCSSPTSSPPPNASPKPGPGPPRSPPWRTSSGGSRRKKSIAPLRGSPALCARGGSASAERPSVMPGPQVLPRSRLSRSARSTAPSNGSLGSLVPAPRRNAAVCSPVSWPGQRSPSRTS